MENQINKSAYQFVELIEEIIEPKSPLVESIGSSKEKGNSGIRIDVADNIFEKRINHAEETIAICISINKKIYGFNEINYESFKLFINDVLSLPLFCNKVSFDFIERKTFDWIIDIYLNKLAKTSLLNYLIDVFVSNTQTYVFYFPMVNLDIETKFKIGNVEFTYFIKDFFENLQNDLKNIHPENKNNFLEREYRGKVLAKVIVKSEKQFAEIVAKEGASLAVDVLKIYGLTATLPDSKTMFDLNYKLNYQLKYNYLSEEIGKKDTLSETIYFNNPPLCITKQRLVFANNNGLSSFSEFITLKANDELYNLIIQGIKLFASALSNWDLHQRIVNLITILESLLLKDDESNDMERRAKARLSKIITDNFSEKEQLKILFTDIYKIRHKMIHKATKIKINIDALRIAQLTIINLILKLMRYNIVGNYKCKTDLIEYLNEIKS